MKNIDIGRLLLLTVVVSCNSFTTILAFATYRPTFVQWSKKDGRPRELNVAPLDDILGNDFIQAIKDSSAIGLPLAGLGAAFTLSKLSVMQRNELRREVEQVQLTIVKKSEEAAIAGVTSNVRLDLFFHKI
jgi:hypothetical protein